MTNIKSTSNPVISKHDVQQWDSHNLPNDAHPPGTFPTYTQCFSHSETLACLPWGGFMLPCLYVSFTETEVSLPHPVPGKYLLIFTHAD